MSTQNPPKAVSVCGFCGGEMEVCSDGQFTIRYCKKCQDPCDIATSPHNTQGEEKYPKLTKPCSYCQKHNLNADDGCGCWEKTDSRREEVKNTLETIRKMKGLPTMYNYGEGKRIYGMDEPLFLSVLALCESLQAQNAELVSKVKVAEKALEWINTVNAMDYEYVKVARKALSSLRSPPQNE